MATEVSVHGETKTNKVQNYPHKRQLPRLVSIDAPFGVETRTEKSTGKTYVTHSRRTNTELNYECGSSLAVRAVVNPYLCRNGF